MTTQSVHWFDRKTGVEIDDDRIVIDSVEPLPDDIREIMLSSRAPARRGAELGAGRESFPPVQGPDPRPALHRRLLLGPSPLAAQPSPFKWGGGGVIADGGVMSHNTTAAFDPSVSVRR